MKSWQKFTDKILLDRAGAGDADAFGALYQRYVGKIYRFIFFRIKEQEQVDDLTNEVFLRTWQQLSDSLKIDNLSAYLYKTARHLIIDHYRSRREQVNIESIELVDESSDLPAELLSDQAVGELLKNIDKLRDDYREVLLLRYVADLSIKEIATVIDKSPGAVKVAIHRAIKKLKDIYFPAKK